VSQLRENENWRGGQGRSGVVMLHYYAGENQLKKLRHELHLDESKVGVVAQCPCRSFLPCGRPCER
jgi:hypothetical protein